MHNTFHITRRKTRDGRGSFDTGKYRNLFHDLLAVPDDLVHRKIADAWNRLFYGNERTERLYFQAAPDTAYIKDIYHNDVRSEGMSYGLMIAVQLDKKDEFDRLWKWTKDYMQHKDGPRKNYFAWQCKTNGTIIDPNSASDGEEWIVMALFFASARWGNGSGIFDYASEAQTVLDTMLHKKDEHGNDGTITNMFHELHHQIVFSPFHPEINEDKPPYTFTDPSYHLPHFYELWARWAERDNGFWFEAAKAGRKFLKKAVHPVTGLAPDYALFDGTPTNHFGGGQADFRYDAWRVAMNVALDYAWFEADRWAIIQSNRLLDFFFNEGLDTYGDQYTLDGKCLCDNHNSGLIAMNAVAALAATNEKRKGFVKKLWCLPVPSGDARYYEGLCYMLGLLMVSGTFRIYHPAP